MKDRPSIETVYLAINTLYHNPDCNKKNEANRWLIELQNSVYAWEIAVELLQKDLNVDFRYFGAQMIRNKIISSFHELSQDEVSFLHNSLMQHLKETTEETNVIITTQLCVSVVDLSLQINSWSNPIAPFLNQYKEIPTPVLLEILKVFPEEIDTKDIRLGSNRRNEIETELSSHVPSLNSYLKEVILRDTSPEILLRAIRCFTSWINLIRNINDIIECDLIPRVFQILGDPANVIYETSSGIESKLHDAAADLLCNMLKTVRGPDADNILNSNFCLKIAAFENAYNNSVIHESTDKSINYCRIFTELGEAFLHKMVHETSSGNPHFSLQILNLILLCIRHHDYEVISITFNFWFSLSELLYIKDNDNITDEFKPYLNRLLTALCEEVQMERDSDGILDDGDDFKIFRDKVCDLVRDSIFIVGSTNTFCHIFEFLDLNSHLPWEQKEANLFIMYCVAWKISPGENNVVPKTVELIFGIPSDSHIAVRHTAVLIVGELRDWFNEHPEYLIKALEYLRLNLEIKDLADAAAGSLCFLCSAAKTKLKKELHPLLCIVKNLHSYALSNKSAIDLMKGFVAVMCQLQSDVFAEALRSICCDQVEPLCNILELHRSSTAIIELENQSNPVVWLDRLASIFRFIEQPNSNDTNGVQNNINSACIAVFTEIYPILFGTMDIYQKNILVMERCCRCIRFGVRALGKLGIFVVKPLVHKLVDLYRENKHSCFLYLSSVLVDEYGYDSANWSLFLQMLSEFIGPTFALLETPTGLRDNPDTIDDLFRLCCRVLQRLPVAFLNSVVAESLIQCALAAIPIDHREANASVMKFLHEILDCSGSGGQSNASIKKRFVEKMYEQYGEALVLNLLRASVFTLPSHTLVNVAEVLFDLIKFNNRETLRWIESAVQKLENPSSVGRRMVLPEQIQTFLNSCEHATKIRDLSKALRDFTLYYL